MRDTGLNWTIPTLEGPSFNTNINIDILNFWNRYQFHNQYSRFWKSIPIPISIPKFWNFNYNTNTNTENFIVNINLDLKTKVLCSQKLLATNCKRKIPHGQVNTDNFEVNKMQSHYIVFYNTGYRLGLTFSPNQ